VCFTALPGTSQAVFSSLAVLHYESGRWVDHTIRSGSLAPDFTRLHICAETPTLSPFAIAQQISIDTFVTYSTDFTWLRSGATVTLGNVGANTTRAATGHAHVDDGDSDDVTVLMAPNVTLPPDSLVLGDTVNLKARASVGNVSDNYSLFNKNAIVAGTRATPLAMPFYLNLPVFPTVTPGTADVDVAKDRTLTLAAGSYGSVHVENGGTLILTGGLYQMLSLDVDQNATVQFEAATEIRVKNEMETLARSKLILDPAVAGLTASQIVIYVEGDDTLGRHDDGDADGDDAGAVTAQIGSNSIVQANIYAANGTVWLKSGTVATGAFIGVHVRIGINVTLTLASAFK
jgi:hypothetical protein